MTWGVGLSVALVSAPALSSPPELEPPPPQLRAPPPEPGWNLQVTGVVLTVSGASVMSGLSVMGIAGGLGLGASDDVSETIYGIYLIVFPTITLVGTILAIAGGMKTRKAQLRWRTQVGAAHHPLVLEPGASGLKLRF